ncbi:MAG: exopolysaccharide biosynthesis polyprenyl glycosylphosphotransferase [Solirubrobacteraceae bacterium]
MLPEQLEQEPREPTRRSVIAYRTPPGTHTPPAILRWRRGSALVALDLFVLGLAVAANAIGADTTDATVGPVGWIAVYIALTIAAITIRRGYRFRLKTSPFEYVGLMIAANAIAATLVLAARVVLDPDPDAAGQVVRLWAFSTVYLIGGRVAAALASRKAAGNGLNTLIIGSGEIGNTIANRLCQRPELGLTPIGFLDKTPLIDAPQQPHGLPILGSSWDLEKVVSERGIEHVIVAFSKAPHQVLLSLVRRCRAMGIEVSLVPRLFEETSRRVTIEHVGGIALTRVDRADPRGWQFEAKYAIDRVVATLLLILLAPLMLLVAALVRLTSPGPVLFRQERVGLDGREFHIVKFRTMRIAEGAVERDDDWVARELGFENAPGEGPEDQRTPLGRFLRRTSLDELPQLLNIVRGEMSFIGPRPEKTTFANAFSQHVYRYGDRHRVKSGLTGWAQVNGLRGQTSLKDRIEWDNFYIENWSPWLDLKILLLTPGAIFTYRES